MKKAVRGSSRLSLPVIELAEKRLPPVMFNHSILPGRRIVRNEPNLRSMAQHWEVAKGSGCFSQRNGAFVLILDR